MRKKCSCEAIIQKVALPFGYEVDGEPQAKKGEPAPDYCAVTLTKDGREVLIRNTPCGDGGHENMRYLAHAIGLAFGAAPVKAKKAEKAEASA